MNGTEFFRLVVAAAMGLLGITAVVGVLRRWMQADAAARAGMWIALEVGLVTILFALLPFPLTYSAVSEMVVWRFGSLMMVLYLTVHLLTVNENRRRYRAQYPVVMRLLLVLSGIFLTMEFINAIWWGSLAGYTWGVLWLLALTGIQLIAFVVYDRQTSTVSAQILPYRAAPVETIAQAAGYGNRSDPGNDARDAVAIRVRGGNRPGDPDGASNHHPDDYARRDSLRRERYRYTDNHSVYSYRRSVADATVRSHAALRRRSTDRDPDA